VAVARLGAAGSSDALSDWRADLASEGSVGGRISRDDGDLVTDGSNKTGCCMCGHDDDEDDGNGEEALK